MPGYDEETVRKSRQGDGLDDPDRGPAKRMDRGAAPDAGAGESIGIGPEPGGEDLGGIGGTGDQTDEELLEDR